MFISLEGIDGAGKTTLCGTLARLLEKRGVPVLLFYKKQVPDDLDPYVKKHLATLARLIWSEADYRPIHLLGDDHWVRLIASYYAAVSDAIIRPALAAGNTVIADNWYYKFFARMVVDVGFDRNHFMQVFDAVAQPTDPVYLDIDPTVAMARKDSFTSGELGHHQRLGAAPMNDFVGYQTEIARFYRELVMAGNWLTIRPGAATPDELAVSVAEKLGFVKKIAHSTAHPG